MSDIYIQISGRSKGNRVKIIREEGGFYRVRSLQTPLIYLVSIRAFEKHYKKVERKPKVKRKPVRRKG